jgi:hypothetical protein
MTFSEFIAARKDLAHDVKPDEIKAFKGYITDLKNLDEGSRLAEFRSYASAIRDLDGELKTRKRKELDRYITDLKNLDERSRVDVFKHYATEIDQLDPELDKPKRKELERYVAGLKNLTERSRGELLKQYANESKTLDREQDLWLKILSQFTPEALKGLGGGIWSEIRLEMMMAEIKSLGQDIRLEVMLAELYQAGLDPRTDVMIHPAGLFARSYRRDIGRVAVGYPNVLEPDDIRDQNWDAYLLDDDEPPTFLNIEVHRDGLYDLLPEGIFHQATTQGRDQNEKFEEIDEQARRVAAARRFFQPIEQEFFMEGLLLELEERKYMISEETLLHDRDQGEVLRSFWGLPANLLDVRQVNNLLFLLPIAHRISTHRELIRQVFELILGVPVEIRSIPPLRFQIELEPGDVSVPNELCRAELGNFSLGGEYQDTMPGTELKIGPLSTDQLIDFIGNGQSRAILNLLISYFLPAETDVTDHLEADTENHFLTLSTDETPSSVLGVASYI